MQIVQVELTPAEISGLLQLARAKLVELERSLQNVEEGEGEDASKFGARRLLLPQLEAVQDVVLKLEGAAREARRRSENLTDRRG